MSTDKTRTITLTDRPPVRIREAEWPQIAVGSGDSWPADIYDGARHDQAYHQGELDRYSIRVRQHADGRTLVYGVTDAGWDRAFPDWRGGELLEPDADVAAAIRRVGTGHLPDAVIEECIADLPAEDL